MTRIDIVLTENQIAEDFLNQFRQRNIPEKFFYWFPLCVRAWLNLCSDGEYRNFARSFSLIRSAADEIARRMAPDTEVVSLGAGQGDKDLILLEAIRKTGGTVAYIPVDASQALLEMACERADHAGISHRGLKLDAEKREHWAYLKPDGRRRLYVVLGNTMGAFDPIEFLRRLREIARPEDFVILDGEIFAKESMAGYDNPTNRRFAFAPLASVGIRETDGALRFETREDGRLAGLYYFPKHFESGRDLDVNVAGELMRLKSGERIDMNLSYKYSRPGLLRLTQEVGGLEPVQEFLSQDGLFLMVLARTVRSA